MGLVLDSSALIAAERIGKPFIHLLLTLETNYAETDFVLSSITVMERLNMAGTVLKMLEGASTPPLSG
ncbi:MAG TPA: hypothetical protein VGG97_13070 [Bryobacteraceae bacterium]|jgi:hypothetical protein